MAWLLERMIASPFKDDQLAAAHVTLQNIDRIDLDIEEKVFRNKLIPREKLPTEDAPEGPGVLHFPGMRSDPEQARLLTLYAQYS